MRNSRFGRIAAVVAVLCIALALSPAASATPIGAISIGIAPGGGVSGNASVLDWFLPNGAGFGDFTTGSGSVQWDGGTLDFTTNTYGRILDLLVTDLAQVIIGNDLVNFIQFYNSGTHNPAVAGSGTIQALPTWDITGIGAPAGVDCTTNPGPNVACSFLVTAASSPIGPYISPLILTENANGGTNVRLDLFLLARDGSGSLPWTGLATAQISNLTPAQVAAAINNNQTVNVTSWSLDMSGVPEPSAVSMMFAGAALLGLGAWRRRRSS